MLCRCPNSLQIASDDEENQDEEVFDDVDQSPEKAQPQSATPTQNQDQIAITSQLETQLPGELHDSIHIEIRSASHDVDTTFSKPLTPRNQDPAHLQALP